MLKTDMEIWKGSLGQKRHIINQHAGEMVLEELDADTDLEHSQTKHLFKTSTYEAYSSLVNRKW